MSDQAKKLRDMIYQLKMKQNHKETSNVYKNQMDSKSLDKTRVITITSGKGGVGKSNFTINLGLCLRKMGYRVTILDADLGLANVDVILGIIPPYTLAHVIRGEKTLKEVMVQGPEGIQLISGGSGLKELVDLEDIQIMDLVEDLRILGSVSDFILIDTGAGMNNSVLSFVEAANEVILITTPEPTSITDAYAVLKNMTLKDNDKKIYMMINRIENDKEGQEVYQKFNEASKRFLNKSLSALGYLYDDKTVSRSVKIQRPFLLSYPNSLVSKGIKSITNRLIDESHTDVFKVNGFKKFLHKLMFHHQSIE